MAPSEARFVALIAALAALASFIPFGLCQSSSSITEKGSVLPNRTYIVTTVQSEPYMMLKANSSAAGNDKFEGFCKDLLDLVTGYLNINYELRLVKDGKYGGVTDNGWNGLVGELIRKEADFAIGDLTINSAREKVIDFTQPFMKSGISIMVKKPILRETGSYVFLKPFSLSMWLMIAISYVVVSLVLFLVRWLTTSADERSADASDKEQQQSGMLSDSFWFPLKSFVQGSDRHPKGFAAFMVSLVWFLFSLAILCLYIAQLVTVLQSPAETSGQPSISSLEDLVNQKEIAYGPVKSGSTADFFRNSKLDTYHRVHQYLEKNPDSVASSYQDGVARVRSSFDSESKPYAFLIETLSNDYINLREPCDTMRVGEPINDRGYGIATPLQSTPLNYYLNLAVLHFQENGEIDGLKKSWWHDKAECAADKDHKAAAGASGPQRPRQLNTGSVSGLFKMLIGLLIIAILIAFIQLLIRSKKDADGNKTSVLEALKTNLALGEKTSKDTQEKEPMKDEKTTAAESA